jgi:hypothetical protein
LPPGLSRSRLCGETLQFTDARLDPQALIIAPRKLPWLDRIQHAVEATPDTEAAFISEMLAELDAAKFVAGDYGIG